MIHQRQRLSLGLEPRNHRAGIHPELDDLEGHAATHRRLLLGHVNDAAATFANLLQQAIATNVLIGFFDEFSRP